MTVEKLLYFPCPEIYTFKFVSELEGFKQEKYIKIMQLPLTDKVTVKVEVEAVAVASIMNVNIYLMSASQGKLFQQTFTGYRYDKGYIFNPEKFVCPADIHKPLEDAIVNYLSLDANLESILNFYLYNMV